MSTVWPSHSSSVLNNKVILAIVTVYLYLPQYSVCASVAGLFWSTFTVYCAILIDCVVPLFKVVFIHTILHHQFSFPKNPNSKELRTSERKKEVLLSKRVMPVGRTDAGGSYVTALKNR